MERLFILGAQKTGTSTMTGLLNSNKNIFVLFEADLFARKITREYRKKIFCDRYPGAKKIFNNANGKQFYDKLHNVLPNEYKYFGDKIPGFRYDVLNKLSEDKAIFIVRNVRTWLCKEHIIKTYSTDKDIVGPAIDYCIYMLKTASLKSVLFVRMEDLIYNNVLVVDKINDFLGVTIINKWWALIGSWGEYNPKHYWPWTTKHRSSYLEPKKEDVDIDEIHNEFLKRFLPIFDKYYNDISNINKYSVNKDIDKLENLRVKYKSPLSKCFKFKQHSLR